MSKRVKLGLAGCGSVSQRGLLPHLAQEDVRQWCELAAVMDPVPGRAQASAAKFGARLWFEDYDELLASEIDAVVIASPIGVHHAQAMKAIAAGKHVHLNKTMTTTRAEADEVIEAARKAGVKIVASPGNAHTARVKRIKQIIEAGEIGRVYWAETGTAGGGHEFESFRQGQDVLSNVNPAWYYRRQHAPAPRLWRQPLLPALRQQQLWRPCSAFCLVLYLGQRGGHRHGCRRDRGLGPAHRGGPSGGDAVQ
jgi:predicted dehydrogenase